MSRSEDSVDTTWSGSPTGGQATQTCTLCGHEYPSPVEYHHDEAECIANIGQERATDPIPRLMAQSVTIPGDLTDISTGQEGRDYSEQVLYAIRGAHHRLIHAATTEGKRLNRPIMVRVVVEAFTEDQ